MVKTAETLAETSTTNRVDPVGAIDPEHIRLTDGVVQLRTFRESDTDAVYEAIRESLDLLAPWLPWAHADYTRDESVTWISQCADGWRTNRDFGYAICDAADGALVGGCGLNQIDHDSRRANLGYWVRASRAGSGFATRAARLLAPWGFQNLGLERIEIVVATSNLRSIRAAEKTGAVREGVLRSRLRVRDRQYDGAMFSFVRADFGLPPVG